MRIAVKMIAPGLIGVAAFSFFINVLMLAVPIYSLQVYDRVMSSQNVMTLLLLTAIVVGLLLAYGVLDTVRNRLLVRVGTIYEREIGPRAFVAALKSRATSGPNALSRTLADVEAVRRLLSSPALGAVFDLPWTPLYLGLLFLFHPLLGVIALGGAVALGVLGLLGELLAKLPSARVGSLGREAGVVVDEADRNADVVLAMGLNNSMLKAWLTPHIAAMREQACAADTSGTLSAISKTFRQLLQVAMLGVGAYLAIQNEISAGVLIAGSIIMGRALVPIEGTIGSWHAISLARSAYGRLERLLATSAADAAMALPRPEGVLSAENLMVRVPTRTAPILYGVSFDLAPGETLGVLGRTAAGKTTLARLLVGVLAPTAGQVRLDGTDVSRWPHEDLGPHIGYLPENPRLFHGTVAQNIARYGEVEAELVIEAARSADVHEAIQTLPNGYDTILEDDESRMVSGGLRQRIALARTLYGNPALVVLDEPDSNVDYEGDRALVKAIVMRKAAKMTTVVISHRQSILACVDKVLLLDGGRIETFGPRDAAIAKIRAARVLIPPKLPDAA